MNLVEVSSKLYIYLSTNLLLFYTRTSEKLIVLLKLLCFHNRLQNTVES